MSDPTDFLEQWVIDASMSSDGLFCFCPIEGDLASGQYDVIHGMNFISDQPPKGGRLVGIVHPDGQQAVERWMTENEGYLSGLRR